MLSDLQHCLINDEEKEMFDQKITFEDPFPENI